MDNSLISRQAAIEAIDETCWYHQNKDKDMVGGANSAEHQPWFKSDDVYAALKSVPSAPRWIPVTERLPEIDEDVLLCYIEYDRWHGQYVSVGQGKRFTFEWVEEGEDENEVEWEWVFANELVHLVEVKYWMPLPEPPKGVEND